MRESTKNWILFCLEERMAHLYQAKNPIYRKPDCVPLIQGEYIEILKIATDLGIEIQDIEKKITKREKSFSS